MRPDVYEDYLNTCNDSTLPCKTGIKCFDHWTEELVETGYLHNHARMWYASIWVFTLRKSWASGANLFRDHLIDWCPASNTLGWRWVAGLQTRGKIYVAKADNIRLSFNCSEIVLFLLVYSISTSKLTLPIRTISFANFLIRILHN